MLSYFGISLDGVDLIERWVDSQQVGSWGWSIAALKKEYDFILRDFCGPGINDKGPTFCIYTFFRIWKVRQVYGFIIMGKSTSPGPGVVKPVLFYCHITVLVAQNHQVKIWHRLFYIQWIKTFNDKMIRDMKSWTSCYFFLSSITFIV